jgi:hypothetical protein
LFPPGKLSVFAQAVLFAFICCSGLGLIIIISFCFYS